MSRGTTFWRGTLVNVEQPETRSAVRRAAMLDPRSGALCPRPSDAMATTLLSSGTPGRSCRNSAVSASVRDSRSGRMPGSRESLRILRRRHGFSSVCSRVRDSSDVYWPSTTLEEPGHARGPSRNPEQTWNPGQSSCFGLGPAALDSGCQHPSNGTDTRVGIARRHPLAISRKPWRVGGVA